MNNELKNHTRIFHGTRGLCFRKYNFKIAQEKTKTEKKLGFAKINDMEMTRK